jgi:simple sugar transport system ATP-binding protein/ribose transport system ATP-binding protein
VLSVRNLATRGVQSASLDVRAGEILGLAGLVGSGRSELARAIFQDTSRTGTVVLAGESLDARSPHGAIKRGLVMIPESRKEQGLLLERSINENVNLSSLAAVSRLGWISRHRHNAASSAVLEQVTVKYASTSMPVSALSGGNQQKVLFARTVLCGPKVLIADEPTRGVDVGSKREIYDLLVSLAESGLGVIVISSDLEEVMGLAHRVLVMRAGEIVADLSGTGMTEEAVLAAAFTEPTRAKEGS